MYMGKVICRQGIRGDRRRRRAPHPWHRRRDDSGDSRTAVNHITGSLLDGGGYETEVDLGDPEAVEVDLKLRHRDQRILFLEKNALHGA